MQNDIDSIEVIKEANDFLDNLKITNEQNMQTVLQFRSKMIELGFAVPFKTLFAKMAQEYIEDSEQESQDIKKHLKEIRYLAFLKKSTLNRARVSIASHKIYKAFEEFGVEHLNTYLPIEGDYKKRIIDTGEYAADAYRTLLSMFENRQYKIGGASALISFEKDGIK